MLSSGVTLLKVMSQEKGTRKRQQEKAGFFGKCYAREMGL
jgi:hypothetical protein